MTAPRRRSRFLVGFAVVALLIAGVLSYFASSSPDGLDATTQRGCEAFETDGGEQLEGTCIAQGATDHHLSSSPLAGYAVRGDSTFTGVAGVVGVLAVLAVSALLFRVLARRRGGP